MKQKVITKREGYLLAITISCLVCLLGACFNMKAVMSNKGMMPIYSGDGTIAKDDIHFTFSNKSQVKYFYLTDIIHTKLSGEGWFSIGDILYIVGGLMIIMLFFKYIFLLLEEQRDNSKIINA